MSDTSSAIPEKFDPANQHKQLTAQQQSVINKLFRRLIVFLFVLFIFSFLDRINIGFAVLTMGQDLGLNATMFGLATTLFYATYVIFGIPSNVMLSIVGARRWIATIMVLWGIASTATMVYFVARMIGCFTGGIVLSKISNRVGILVCGTIMTASAVCFAIFCSITSNPPVALFWVAVALVGFGNSNVFSLFLSHALMYRPERQNEISGLMLMGLIGGAIFPPIMGALADAMSVQLGAIIVMSVGCIYMLVIGVGYKAIIEGKKAAVKA